MQNLFVDALDRFVAEAELEHRWAAAEEFVRELGIKSVLVAKVHERSLDVSWVNTNMPVSWMEEYLHQNYIGVDSLVSDLSGKSGTQVLNSGLLSKSSAQNALELDYDQGLRIAGFGTLVCTRFAQPNEFGTFVCFGFDHLSNAGTKKWVSEGKILSALLAVNIQSPLDDKNNDLVKRLSPQLTARQQDVLCLLATGLQTGRIAEKLQITEASVSFHFANARKALGAQTREQALAIALKRGLINP